MRWSSRLFSSALALAAVACAPPAGVDDRAPAGDMVELSVLAYDEPAHLMGFAVDDASYLARIPPQARTVPASVLTGRFFYDSDADHQRGIDDPDAPIPAEGIVAFRSYEAAGDFDYAVRRIGRGASGDYEQWYLLDVTRYLRAVIAVHRETRRAYFFEIIGVDEVGDRYHYIKGGDHCYKCHASGLRTISVRDGDPLVDRARLEALNRDILDHGVVDFADDIDRVGLGEPIGACVDCHDGEQRGRLYPVHHEMIRYRVETSREMPPDGPLSPAAAATLMAGICDSPGACAME